MAFKFSGVDSAFRARSVRIEIDGGDFTVRIREPTVDGQARILLAGVSENDRIGNLSGRSFCVAVEECVMGWDGVLDMDGRVVPYKPALLLEIARRNPTTVMVELVTNLYQAISGFQPEEPRHVAQEAAGGVADEGTMIPAAGGGGGFVGAVRDSGEPQKKT